MLRAKRVKNGTTGGSRISSVAVGAWLIFGWSRPAFADDQPHLRLAPIQFRTEVGGNLQYTYERYTIGAERTTQQRLDLGVGAGFVARSFIWQPWLAKVTGAFFVNVTTDAARITTSNGNPLPTSRSGNTTILGDARLDVLDRSRFPFAAHIYRSGNQANGFLAGTNSDFVNTGLDLTQQYRARNGLFDAIGGFVYATNGRADFGSEDIRRQANLTLNAEPYAHQTVRVIGTLSTEEHPLKGDNSMNNSFMGTHIYQPTPGFSVGTLLDLNHLDFNVTSPTSPQQSAYTSQQLSSTSAWRPEGTALTMTGSARVFRENSAANGVSSPASNDTNLDIGANYAWSPLIRMYGSLNVDDSNGVQTVMSTANLTAQKGFGAKGVSEYEGFRYTKSVNASLSNTTNTTTNADQTTTTTSVQSLGTNIGHDLSRAAKIGSGNFRMDLNQGLSTVVTTAGSPTTRLLSTGSLAWNRNDSSGMTVMRLSGADNRYLSTPNSFFDLINLQASRSEQVGRDQSLIGNLTIQGTRSGSRIVPGSPFITSPSADLTYHNMKLFHVKNLDFTSTLQLHGAEILSYKDPTYQPQPSTASWDNNLNYFIGRLKVALTTHVAEISNTLQSSILFTMNRSF